MDSNATELAAKMTLGINVGNQMESRGCTPAAETCWGHPKVSEAYIKLVKDSGFDAIRLPVSWDQYADQSTGKISDVWLNRVKEVVQYAVDNELYVIVNIHWDGGWLERNFSDEVKDAVNAKQKAYWEQIATLLRDFDERVLFASANEPDAEHEDEIAVLDMYHQTFVDAVRSTGGKNAYRVLVIQGPKTDIEVTFNAWPAMPSDTVTGRQMAEVHFYPFSFTNQDEDIVADWGTLQAFCYWGEGNHSETDTYRNSTREEEDYVDAKFAQMKTKFADQGIPVVLGEFAARPRTEEVCTDYSKHLASRAYYAQYVTQGALENGMLPFFWDTGEVFNRGTPAVNNQQTLDALLIGAGKMNGSSSSSQSSSANSSSSSTEVSSSSSSSAATSSDSNLLTLDMNSSNWEADHGVVMNQSDSDIQLTLSSSGKIVFYNIEGPIDLLGAKFTVLFNFDSDYVASVNAGVETGILQFMSVEKTSFSDEFKCWTGWYTIVAGQDVGFSCDQLTKNNPQAEGVRIGVQFFGNTGTVTIKSATLELAE